MPVRVTNTQRTIRIPAGSLRKAARLALSSLGYEGAELSVLITGARKMRALNRLYRGMDRTTDVLSFSMLEEGKCKSPQPLFNKGRRRGDLKMDAASMPPLALGDIVICAPVALSQARDIGQSLKDELIFLLVHGILHLVGYDHEGPVPERLRMERKQRALIRLITKR